MYIALKNGNVKNDLKINHKTKLQCNFISNQNCSGLIFLVLLGELFPPIDQPVISSNMITKINRAATQRAADSIDSLFEINFKRIFIHTLHLWLLLPPTHRLFVTLFKLNPV